MTARPGWRPANVYVPQLVDLAVLREQLNEYMARPLLSPRTVEAYEACLDWFSRWCEGRARVRPEITRHVEFTRINLMDAQWPVKAGLDAIFCRNVMIYFDKPTQRRLIDRYAALLRPSGLFFAGHAESLLDQGRRFRLRGQTVYELLAGAPA